MMRVRDIVAALGLAFMCAISVPAAAQTPSGLPMPKPAAAPSTVAPAPNDIPAPTYILGPQDVIQVDALGRSDFTTKARIGADGTVQLPFLGAFPAADRSVVQLPCPIRSQGTPQMWPFLPHSLSLIVAFPECPHAAPALSTAHSGPRTPDPALRTPDSGPRTPDYDCA